MEWKTANVFSKQWRARDAGWPTHGMNYLDL
jgi:hypothetical protein